MDKSIKTREYLRRGRWTLCEEKGKVLERKREMLSQDYNGETPYQGFRGSTRSTGRLRRDTRRLEG